MRRSQRLEARDNLASDDLDLIHLILVGNEDDLLHAGRGTLPSKIRQFLDFAASRLRDRLSAL